MRTYTLPRAGTGPPPICLSTSCRIRIKPSGSGRDPRMARMGRLHASPSELGLFSMRLLQTGHTLVPHATSCAFQRGHVAEATLVQADTLLTIKCHQFLLPVARVSEPVKFFRLHLYAEFCSRHLQFSVICRFY